MKYAPINVRILVAVLGLVVCLPASASAHGRLKSSAPGAGTHLPQVPRELRLDFSEAPDMTFSTLRLIGPDGKDVALGAVAYAADSHRALVAPIAGTMAAGTFVIVWQMAGDDGHPVRGRIEFVVAPGAMGVGIAPVGVHAVTASAAASGDTSMAGMHHDPVSMPEGNGFGAESFAYVIIRWVQFVGLLLAIGAVSFHTFVLAAIRRDPRSAGQATEASVLPAVESRAARVGHVASMVLAVALLARLAAQAYAMHGGENPFDPATTGPMITRTMWGWGWMLQLVGIALAGIGFHKARAISPARAGISTGPNHFWWRVAGLGALVLAFSPGLASHASSAPQFRLLAMLADGLHVLGASSWLGTLSVVLFAGLSVARDRREQGDAFVRDLINAFSPVALVSAGVATTTGVFAAWLHVGTIPNLWGTRYGITLLVKLGVLGVVTLSGFYNWRFVQPRLGTREATAHLRSSAMVEVAVAVIVLLVTAVLVASPTSLDMIM